MKREEFERLKNNLRVFKYTIAIFVIIIFLWWFQGGHIVSILAPKPSPAELAIIITANAFKTGLATIFNAILSLFK